MSDFPNVFDRIEPLLDSDQAAAIVRVNRRPSSATPETALLSVCASASSGAFALAISSRLRLMTRTKAKMISTTTAGHSRLKVAIRAVSPP